MYVGVTDIVVVLPEKEGRSTMARTEDFKEDNKDRMNRKDVTGSMSRKLSEI